MREIGILLLTCLIPIGVCVASYGQSAKSTTVQASPPSADLEERLETISSSLDMANKQLEQSRKEIQQLRQELSVIKGQLDASRPVPFEEPKEEDNVTSAKTTASTIEDLQERQQTLEEQVKLHEQTKIESDSKYPVRVTGLILFNSFINKGIVDNIDLPEVALGESDDASNGSTGASFRQTVIGLQGFGPKVARAKTSAYVNLDFFGGLAYGSSATSAGIVRMRTAGINFDWNHDSIQAGMVGPLISPLSPTSYATVAEPSLAGAGNLWTWSPQLRYARQIPLRSTTQVQFEVGLWDPQTAGYSTNLLFRAPSPGEYSKQPAYETRISYGTATKNSYGDAVSEHPFQIGLGGYYSRQNYSYGEKLDTWAVTTDWRIPFGRRFEVSGEGYRGLGLGGLGGGVYKDVLIGLSPVTGENSYRGLNAIGGWTQLKAYFSRSIEANASIGLDDGFAGDFHTLVFPTATAVQLRARNKMVVANLIFKPKTYIIFSPEYRRIWTWPIDGPGATANIFSLSAGYQF
jgi:chaperonin cofactor prefoldin